MTSKADLYGSSKCVTPTPTPRNSAAKYSFVEWKHLVDPDRCKLDEVSCWTKYVNKLVIYDSNPGRKAWHLIIAIILVYTGTVFPFKLAFIDFAIPDGHPTTTDWDVIQFCCDRLFELDLLAGFLFTYQDNLGREVADIRLITCQYLKTTFIINVIACIPPDVAGKIYGSWLSDMDQENQNTDEPEHHQMMRIARLQRISKLARLVRLARLSKLVTFLYNSKVIQWLWNFRTTRVLNFLGGLLWVSHLMACGWYVVAALHNPWEETWVYGRIGEEAQSNYEPFRHWLHAMYWVLTVFTTVGFGDICPGTDSETVYAMFTMLVGCVANGIILSEVINIITEADTFAREINAQKALVEGFSQHVKLREDCAKELVQWVSDARAFQYSYDRQAMKDMFLRNSLPTRLTSRLPEAIMSGQLLNSKFVRVACANMLNVPSRFVLLISLAINARIFDHMETVYHAHDHVWNVFLVYKGVFANVAKPTAVGGVSELPHVLQHAGKQAFGTRSTSKASSGSGFGSSMVAKDVVETSLQAAEKLQNLMTRRQKETAKVCETQGFVPYQLFTQGNYFGDVEIFRNRQGSRRSCTRCEAKEGGTLLVLGKNDLNEISSAFPMSHSAWRILAAQREVHRKYLLRKLYKSTDYENLAAYIVQWHFRAHRYRKGKGPGNSGPKLWGVEDGIYDEMKTCKSRGFSSDWHEKHFKGKNNAEAIGEVDRRIDRLESQMKSAHSKLDFVIDKIMARNTAHTSFSL